MKAVIFIFTILVVAIIFMAIAALIVVLVQRKNYKKGAELIKQKEKHLKNEHGISSYNVLQSGDTQLPVIVKKDEHDFVEVVAPKEPEKIVGLMKSKKILKKSAYSKMLSSEELAEIQKTLQ